MPEPKRKVGRPRKVVEEVNPDCEPASKGYVKCIARQVITASEHTHRVDEPDHRLNGFMDNMQIISTVTTMVALITAFLMWCIYNEPSSINKNLSFAICIASASITMVFAIIWLVCEISDRARIGTMYTRCQRRDCIYPESVRACEPKKEKCE